MLEMIKSKKRAEKDFNKIIELLDSGRSKTNAEQIKELEDSIRSLTANLGIFKNAPELLKGMKQIISAKKIQLISLEKIPEEVAAESQERNRKFLEEFFERLENGRDKTYIAFILLKLWGIQSGQEIDGSVTVAFYPETGEILSKRTEALYIKRFGGKDELQKYCLKHLDGKTILENALFLLYRVDRSGKRYLFRSRDYLKQHEKHSAISLDQYIEYLKQVEQKSQISANELLSTLFWLHNADRPWNP
jgi:hypothetical protein